MNRSKEKRCRSAMEGVRKRFALLSTNIKTGDGMISCNWLATSKKRGGGMRN